MFMEALGRYNLAFLRYAFHLHHRFFHGSFLTAQVLYPNKDLDADIDPNGVIFC